MATKRVVFNLYVAIITGVCCGIWIAASRNMPWWAVVAGIALLVVAINIIDGIAGRRHSEK